MENYNNIKTTKEEKRTEIKTYYEAPTQVAFYMAKPGIWEFGIAYHDEIICTCCGGVSYITQIIDDFNNYTKEKGTKISKPIYDYDSWCNISDSVYGGELPEGLGYDNNNDYIEIGWVDKDEPAAASEDIKNELIDKRFLR